MGATQLSNRTAPRQAPTLTALALFSLAVALGACASREKPAIVIPASDKSERLARAAQIAGQAQQAQTQAARTDNPERRAELNQRAMDLYRQAIEHSADLWSAWNNLGVLHMERGEYAEASRMFQVAADVAPADPRPLENLGVLYHQNGNDREAIQAFKQALAREPNYLPAVRGYVRTAKRLGLTDETSLELVRRGLMLESDPDWRRVFEAEQVRLEARVRGARRR